MDAISARLPLILLRGWGGLTLSDEQESPYYGFNDGTVYPQKLGENYIYEGLILKLLKSDFRYQDATNVIRYYSGVHQEVEASDDLSQWRRPETLPEARWETLKSHFRGFVRVDPTVALDYLDCPATIWVYRYYDFGSRDLKLYAEKLKDVIAIVKAVTGAPMVNLLAHSMGGLVARWLIQNVYAAGDAEEHINKLVTLGTPHGGIAFQKLASLRLMELEHFNREYLDETMQGDTITNFNPERCLCIIGTDHRAYGARVAAWLNSLGDWWGSRGSDGLVKQENAAIKGAYRAYVHKPHGGRDSLVTAREAFEIGTRFLFGDVRLTLSLLKGQVKGSYGDGLDGRPEFFLGFSLKPRGVDFWLNRQHRESENCFGPFQTNELQKEGDAPRVIHDGFLDTRRIVPGQRDIVFRLDIYVGERDVGLGGLLGHSDTVVLEQETHTRVVLDQGAVQGLEFYPYGIPRPEHVVHWQQVAPDRFQVEYSYPTFEMKLEATCQRLMPPEA